MQFKDQVDFVRQHIKKNRLRVFMTVLAATMGTAFLIVLASVGFGIHETIRDEMLSNRLVTEIQVHESEKSGNPGEKVDDMKNMAHVKAVVDRQQLGTNQMSLFGEFEGHHTLIVTDFEEEGKVGFALKEGRLPQNMNEIVVGSHFAEGLYTEQESESGELKTYDGELIGEQISYRIGDVEGEFAEEELSLTIVGIGENPSREWVHDQNIYAHNAIIPKLEQIHSGGTEMEESKAGELFYHEVAVYVDKLENVKAVANTLRDDQYYVFSIADELEQIDVFFLALKAGLVFVGTIAILIASIGIFNTMTMAVTERTREIGVMKAIGADPKLIRRLFLMESAWIGVIGTVLAVAISYVVSAVSNYLLPIIVSAALGEEDLGELGVTFSVIPWQLILIASAISISVAMVSGWRPARKATQIDVIDALRREL